MQTAILTSNKQRTKYNQSYNRLICIFSMDAKKLYDLPKYELKSVLDFPMPTKDAIKGDILQEKFFMLIFAENTFVDSKRTWRSIWRANHIQEFSIGCAIIKFGTSINGLANVFPKDDIQIEIG